MAGMESIVAPGGRRTDDAWVNENSASLFAAVYFIVIMRVEAITLGTVVDRAAYVPRRKEILALLNRARKEVTVKDVDEQDAWVGWKTLKTKDFDLAVEQVNTRDWLAGDWYTGIADLLKQVQRPDTDMLDDDDLAPEIQLRRADTMFQEKYDFLSDARRSDYNTWKESMLLKISEFTAANDDMEIDTK